MQVAQYQDITIEELLKGELPKFLDDKQTQKAQKLGLFLLTNKGITDYKKLPAWYESKKH